MVSYSGLLFLFLLMGNGAEVGGIVLRFILFFASSQEPLFIIINGSLVYFIGDL